MDFKKRKGEYNHLLRVSLTVRYTVISQRRLEALSPSAQFLHLAGLFFVVVVNEHSFNPSSLLARAAIEVGGG